MSASESLSEIKVDVENLYMEENYTDLKVASIRKMVPIKVDGSPDESRKASFVAQTNIMSQMGPVPVNCQIEAETLDEAIGKFPEAVQEAVNNMIEEAKDMQRQQASKIVVPDASTSAAAAANKIHLT
ncbi:MAG: cytoplasmic protein [Planctomycetota bacterium]|jgi:hypothetical protein